MSTASQIKERLCPDVRLFVSCGAGLPRAFGRILFVLQPWEWMVYTWLLLRAQGKGIVVSFDRNELMYDLGYHSPAKMQSSLVGLERLGFVRVLHDEPHEHVLILAATDVVATLLEQDAHGQARREVLEEVLQELAGA